MEKLQSAARDAVLAHAGLGDDARAAIDGIATVPELVAVLEAGGFLLEAARCVAHGLPRREAVWWAAMCARHTAPHDLPDDQRAACEAAELWVRKQTEDVRRDAMAKAEAVGFQTPEAWAAVGAFWAGPSIAPADLPPVAPASHLTGVAVAGAVVLSSVRGEAGRRLARLSRFLGSAREIATGGAGRLPPETDT